MSERHRSAAIRLKRSDLDGAVEHGADRILTLLDESATYPPATCLRNKSRAFTMGALEELPLIKDPTTWPVALDLPAVSLLRVLHYTSQADVNEGGFLMAINGRTLPMVFVGDEPQIPEPPDGSPEHLLEPILGVARGISEAGRLRYDSVEELILDGWRP